MPDRRSKSSLIEQSNSPRRSIREATGGKAYSSLASLPMTINGAKEKMKRSRYSTRNNDIGGGVGGLTEMFKTPQLANQGDSMTNLNISNHPRSNNKTPTPNAMAPDYLRESLRQRGALKGLTEIRNLPISQYEERKVESMLPGPQ